jgi:hypothetical protein
MTDKINLARKFALLDKPTSQASWATSMTTSCRW